MQFVASPDKTRTTPFLFTGEILSFQFSNSPKRWSTPLSSPFMLFKHHHHSDQVSIITLIAWPILYHLGNWHFFGEQNEGDKDILTIYCESVVFVHPWNPQYTYCFHYFMHCTKTKRHIFFSYKVKTQLITNSTNNRWQYFSPRKKILNKSWKQSSNYFYLRYHEVIFDV